MEKITVKELAQLKGCTERYIRKLIDDGMIQAESTFGRGGRNGLIYLIPVISLASYDPKLLRKYNRIHGIKAESERKQTVRPELLKNVEQLTEDERAEVAFWKKTLADWTEYRNGKNREQADEEYVTYLRNTYSDMKFSVRQLYRKQKAYRENGDAGLVDWRGKHASHQKAIPDTVFGIFAAYYLDESRKTVAECIRLTELCLKAYGEEQYLPLASETTFARYIEREIDVPAIKYYRFGEKAFRDECMSYIKRTYDDLQSNDIWVCDNHTFDVILRDGEEDKPIRVCLTAFLDVRSRKMVGWYVTDNPCSDATLQALRRGIERYGIPKRILADNGREFVTHDIGGRGFRKSRQDDCEHVIPTILDHLQVEFRTAMVRNARAKIVERAFRDVKECFSRLFRSFTGGSIIERPERLKHIVKQRTELCPYEDFEQHVDKYIEGIFNRTESNGIGMNRRTRNEVYAENLYEMRKATQAELNLMMLRNSRMVTVRRDGVVLKLYGTELTYWSDELLMHHIGEKVYYRYNPDDLSEVRIYDEHDRFVCTASQHTALSYFADKEDVAEKMREQRQLEKMVKSYMKEKNIQARDALELIMAQAEENMRSGEHLDPKIITLIRAMEETDEPEAYELAAAGGEPFDWSPAIERLRAVKEVEAGDGRKGEQI